MNGRLNVFPPCRRVNCAKSEGEHRRGEEEISSSQNKTLFPHSRREIFSFPPISFRRKLVKNIFLRERGESFV